MSYKGIKERLLSFVNTNGGMVNLEPQPIYTTSYFVGEPVLSGGKKFWPAKQRTSLCYQFRGLGNPASVTTIVNYYSTKAAAERAVAKLKEDDHV